jgi:hypothetical protein
MLEFILSLRSSKNTKIELSVNDHLSFVKASEKYFEDLITQGKLIMRGPVVKEGVVVKRTSKGWIRQQLGELQKIQIGYYVILATDLDEAVEIAKENPEFNYIDSATIEVRPLNTNEIKALASGLSL